MSKKKVLIVSYYWPPAGGISVLRSLKIAKYLSEFGWQPVVYTISNPQYPLIDEDNFKHVPEDAIVIKQPSFEVFNLFKKLTGRKTDNLQNILYVRDKKLSLLDKFFIWVRGNYFIPDARSLWVKPSVKFLNSYLKKNPVDAIFSDGPPHTNTLIAARVSKAADTPWLMDFQDPWTQVDYYRDFTISARAHKKHKKLELECLQIAAKTTIVSPTWKKDLETIGGHNISVIPWGYDEDDYLNIEARKNSKFSITHIGTLGKDRLPETLFKVLAEIVSENAQFSQDLSVCFIGSVDFEIKKLLEKYKLQDNVSINSQVPRREAIQALFDSSVLLLLLNRADNAIGRIPGKLFEYLRAGKNILCLGPDGSDVEGILTETNSGKSYEYDNFDGLKPQVLDYYNRYKEKNLFIDQRNLNQYSIRKLTKKIAGYLDEISIKTTG